MLDIQYPESSIEHPASRTMLWIIAKKQLLDNIFSLRFSIALVLCFVLIVISVFVSIEDYARQVDDLSDFLKPDQYKEAVTGHWDIPRLGEGPTPVTRPIPALRVLSRGLGDDTSLIATIRPFVGAIYSQKAFVTNTALDLFPAIDLVLIVNVVVSLLAMTFTYDSISGDKANGTLKLLLSNPVPRYQILLGRSLGSYISFLMSYIPSLIGVALLMLLHPKIALTGSQWWAVILIFITSIIYAKVFFCLGLLVSCRAKDPKTSLLTLLAIWVFLALIIPNFSPYLVAEIHPTRTPYEIEAELNRIGFQEAKAAWDRVREFMGPALEERLREIMISRNLKPAPGGSWNLDYGTWSDGARWIVQDIEDENASNELQWACSRSARTELRNVTSRSLKVKHDHITSIRKQMALSKAFSALSPVAAFTYLATDLANTGIRDERHFRGTVDVFENEFVTYVGEKLANQKFLDRPDISDMPSFRYEPLKTFAIARDNLIHLLLLALFSIVFFMAAHLSFLRYDVR